MSRELTHENAKEAYCKLLVCVGIGAAEGNCEDLLPKKVLVVTPEPMHEKIPGRFLPCAYRVCTNEPYEWTVQHKEPDIDDDTTFEDLYQDWFIQIIA